MIPLETNIEGKQMTFGYARRMLKDYGLHMGGSWDYHYGFFDGIMHREGGETIYLRLPVIVIKGELDHENALIEFQRPFIIKHVANTGLERETTPLLTATGLSQFQKPLDTDGYIEDKSRWAEIGEEAIGDLLNDLKR